VVVSSAGLAMPAGLKRYYGKGDLHFVTFSCYRRFPFAAPREPLRAFWQARFYDFNVYSRGKKREKLNYMHANPVKRGLVNHPRDWAWSSWAYYFGGEKPLLPMDV